MSVIIDGAVPHTEAERVSILLDYAIIELDSKYKECTWETFPVDLYKKYYELEAWYRAKYGEDDYEWWSDLEDQAIDLCNDLLPNDTVMLLHPDDPGTVVVWSREKIDTSSSN